MRKCSQREKRSADCDPGKRGRLVQVRNIESIDLNLDDLFECRYIKIRFGRLPLDSVKKLQYYRNRPFVFNHSARMILTAGVCI